MPRGTCTTHYIKDMVNMDMTTKTIRVVIVQYFITYPFKYDGCGQGNGCREQNYPTKQEKKVSYITLQLQDVYCRYSNFYMYHFQWVKGNY